MDDYDSPWKQAVTCYLQDFLALFFPAAHVAIDWAAGYCFLDQELQSAAPDAGHRAWRADKLARLTLRDRSPAHLHIEIQCRREAAFAERMLTYNTRLRDTLHAPVASFTLLADPSPTWRPSGFSFDQFGYHLAASFPVAKLLDYRDNIAALTASDNPVALIAAAHLCTQQSRGNPERRLALKSTLVATLFARGWPLDRTLELYRLIDWLMRLPPALQTAIFQQCTDHIRRRQMPFENSLIHYWKDEGRREGLSEGRVAGRAEGTVQGQRRMLLALLAQRFGQLPTTVCEQIAGAEQKQLDAWGLALLQSASLDELFGAARQDPAKEA
jgi:hypothetical protein